MSGDVCIVGVGIHRFGRTDGVSGLEQGVYAVNQALGDAGIDWPQIQFAYGSSDAAGNPDTMVERLGLTGVHFINVRNGCAAGGSALFSAQMAIKSGNTTWGWRSASTSTRAARSMPCRRNTGCPNGTARPG